MKYILIAVAALTISCGYNLKTDQEISNYRLQIVEEQEVAEALRASLTHFKDSMVSEYQKEIKVRQRLQDSLVWVNTRAVQCWEKTEHRHSCDSF